MRYSSNIHRITCWYGHSHGLIFHLGVHRNNGSYVNINSSAHGNTQDPGNGRDRADRYV